MQESKFDLTPIPFKIPNTEITIYLVKLPQWKKDKQQNWHEQPPAIYMKVPQRLVWFNLEKPDWIIETDLTITEDATIQAKCLIKDPSGKIMRTAHKSIKYTNAKDWDAAETGAIGRCLALLGYGTQYASGELEEDDDDPVDAPTALIKTPSEEKDAVEVAEKNGGNMADNSFWKPKTESLKNNVNQNTGDSGNFIMPISKKFLGWKLKDIPLEDLKWWIEAVTKESEKTNISNNKKYFLLNANEHLKSWEGSSDDPLPF